MYSRQMSGKATIHTHHLDSGNPSEKIRINYFLLVKSGMNYIENSDFHRMLNTDNGLTFLTSVSIKTDDGLINVMTCVLKIIQNIEGNVSMIPSIL